MNWSREHTGKMVVAGAVGAILLFAFWPRGWEVKNAPPKDGPIVAFGDSLVYGVGATPGNNFVSVLSRKIGVPIINMGTPGDTTTDGLRRLPQVRAEDPAIVLLLLGGNDYLQRQQRAETFKNLETIITTLQGDGALVVLLGVRGGILKDNFEERYETLAEETGALYVPDVLHGLITNKEFMSDAIHPNDVGYARIAEKVYRALERFL